MKQPFSQSYSFYRQHFGWNLKVWSRAMRIDRQTVSLPLSANLNDGEVARGAESIVSGRTA